MLKKFCIALLVCAATALCQIPELDPGGAGVRPGTVPHAWTPASRCMEVPEWQIHEYNSDFFIIRESGCVNYEKPLLYLLFGETRAILFDTGSGEVTITPMIKRVVTQWLSRKHKASIELIVAHTHAHEDHIAGDAQLKTLQTPAIKTTVIAIDVKASQSFFHIAHWPDDIGSVDLGGRIVDVIPIPGHDYLSIAYYDRSTGVLISGDTLCPGRVYVDLADFKELKKSVQRMVSFTEGKVVAHVFGAHIEETRTPYLEYPFGTLYQPDEHDLSLSRAHLLEMKAALDSMGDKPVVLALKDFTIAPFGPEGWKQVVANLDATVKASQATMWDQPPAAITPD